jgi:hypothetical protein
MNVGKSRTMNALTRLFSLVVICLSLFLAGCDQIGSRLGLEDPAKKVARLEAEGKAVGGGCRQSGRAIEDCYAIYTWVPKEAVFEGWREMDEYMRENNLDTITPVLPPPPPPPDPNAKKKKKAPPSEEGDADGANTGEGSEATTPDAGAKAAIAPPFSAPVPVMPPAARVVAVTPPVAASATPAATPAVPPATAPAPIPAAPVVPAAPAQP